MNVKVYTNKDLEKARKKAAAREERQEKLRRFRDWCVNNRETIMVLAPSVLCVTAKGVKALHRSMQYKKERDLKELYCYDRSLGHYWRLRRSLSNDEWTEISMRRDNGESLANILSDLNVLK